MEIEPYYMAYEKRYKSVYESGAERWGHSPDDVVLYETLYKWVEINNLTGKHIIEFACGEGACGEILSHLGCKYHGVDVSPTAVDIAKKALQNFPDATVEVLDMVNNNVGNKFDASVDCMGLHMLVTDNDRRAYLHNAYNALNIDAPMLFFRESYNEVVYKDVVHSFDEWRTISGIDYTKPSLRRTNIGDKNIEVLIPLVPARANDKDGYIAEMKNAGFRVECFIEMESSSAIQHSATIYVRK